MIFEGTLQNDIAGKGGQDSLVIEKTMTSPWADNQLELFFIDLASDGSASPVDFNTYNNIAVSLELEVVQLNEIELFGNIDHTVRDTIDYNSESDGSTSEFIENGHLNLFVENGAPLNYAIQAFFLDKDFLVVDSLFDNATIAAPDITPSGYVINSTITEEKVTADFSNERYTNIQNNSSYVAFRLTFQSSPQNIRITTNDRIELYLTADVATTFKF